ncbi:LysM peptidoglycan-binding domain-containing protein [Lactobacillus sp. AN1001]
MQKLLKKIVVVIAAMTMFLSVTVPVSANAVREKGTDTSKYQGANAQKAQGSDTFSIAQIGGSIHGVLYDQWTYNTQISTGIAQGLRMHTYIWMETGNSIPQTAAMLNYHIPKIQTPKGSIVALDYEQGASDDVQGNTDNVLYGMRRLRDAGYTPMLYSGKYFIADHLQLNRILAEFPNSIWVASYPTMAVTQEPAWGYFPSMDGVAIWQFTSMARADGLDYNVDLLGITHNGYDKGNIPVNKPEAVKEGIKVDDTPKKDVAPGYTVKVNFGATNWSNGVAIPNWVKGRSYTVLETSGDKVLLKDIMFWINRKDVEILQIGSQANVQSSTTSSGTYVVRSGDSWWGIAHKYGMNMYTLALLNGKTINSVIYPGEVLKINGTVSTLGAYVVRSGDTLSSIAARFGTSVGHLQAVNGISNANIIFAGQRLIV